MKAVLEGKDGKLGLFEVPDPVAAPDGVVLKIHAAALNRADILQRDGMYPAPEGWPEWFGLEAAGEIVAVGEETAKAGKWKIGDKACALLGGGGYAEYVAVPSGMLMPVPEGLSMVEAAALPEAFGASWLFLFAEGGLKQGDTVLVLAGSSGLSSVTIPLAKAFGARVITTVRSEASAQSIAHLGADRIVNTAKESLTDVMDEELAAGHGVDIAIDCLGGPNTAECLPHMNRGGRWIMIATLAGDISPVNLRMLYARCVRLIGTTLRSRTSEYKAAMLAEMVEKVWPMVTDGRLRPTICKVFPIEQAEEAQAFMRSGHYAGKIVLTVREE